MLSPVRARKTVLVGAVVGAPIRHFYKPADGDNFFWVGKGTELWDTLEFTFQGKGTKHHPAKVHKASAQLRMYFQGGSTAIVGDGAYSSITLTNNWAGICNLEFDIRH